MGGRVLDAVGRPVGRLRDVAVRPEVDHPLVSSLRVAVPGHETVRIEWREVESPDVLTAGPNEPLEAVRARAATLERAPEGLLTAWVLDGDGRPVGVLGPRALLGGEGGAAPVRP